MATPAVFAIVVWTMAPLWGGSLGLYFSLSATGIVAYLHRNPVAERSVEYPLPEPGFEAIPHRSPNPYIYPTSTELVPHKGGTKGSFLIALIP